MKKISREDYQAFDWLPIRRWNRDTLMGPSLGINICCKICDIYIRMSEADEHIDRHIAQRKRQITEDRRKAKALRLENMRRARLLKKEANSAGEL